MRGFYLFSQVDDSSLIDNWKNFDRTRGVGDSYIHSYVNKQYLTSEGDTLVRSLSISGEFHQILKEESFVHNKLNGLEIEYYPNGNVREINYYLDGNLWEVISRADSNGKLYNPGNLHNGNGVRFFFDHYGLEPNCYETYKNGVPEGPFFWRNTDLTYLKGELTYKPSVVRYLPAKKVTFVNSSGRQTTRVFDTSLYRNIFVGDRADPELKVLSVSNDSLQERPRDYRYIDINFDDPAIIPRGNWEVVNVKNGKPMTTVEFDNNGNPIKVARYDDKGNLVSQETLPSYNTRVW